MHFQDVLALLLAIAGQALSRRPLAPDGQQVLLRRSALVPPAPGPAKAVDSTDFPPLQGLRRRAWFGTGQPKQQHPNLDIEMAVRGSHHVGPSHHAETKPLVRASLAASTHAGPDPASPHRRPVQPATEEELRAQHAAALMAQHGRAPRKAWRDKQILGSIADTGHRRQTAKFLKLHDAAFHNS